MPVNLFIKKFGSLVGTRPPALRIFLVLILLLPAIHATRAQNAFLADAWWTFQQDCNGDGCKAGTLPGDMARLNWEPDVTNCNGTLMVFEIVYSKPTGYGPWIPVYTNAPHSITGCRSSGQQHVDLSMNGGCADRDYKIEIYRDGQADPDFVLGPTNDVDLSAHREQLLSEDFCLSDFFATCVSMTGPAGSISDNNQHATKEPGEPDHAGNPGGHSLWFCWTATTNTDVTFDTSGTTFDTLLAIYTGSTVSNLSLIASNDDIAGATNRLSKVTFTPISGTTYHIAVDGFGGACGIITLNWNQTGSPLPDLIPWGPAVSPTVITRSFATGDCEVVEGCATPGTLRLLSWSTETRNIGSGDLILGSPETNSLFYWASCHQHYHFEHFAEYNLLDTNGNIVATGHKVGFCLMDVHPVSPASSQQVKYNCNYQGVQAGWADIYEAGLPCQYIDVTSVQPGNYLLQITINPDNLLPESNLANNTVLVPVTIPPADCASAPTNDNFADAMPISKLPFNFTEFTYCATMEPGEPNHANKPGGASVWFSFIPSSNQTVVITTKRSDYDTLLAVYTGSSVSNLSLVASNDDIVPSVFLQSSVSFEAVAGTNYWIAVDGYSGAVGTLNLNVDPPGNDDFMSAFPIFGSNGSTNGTTLGASKEPYEPAHAYDVGGHSVWFDWLAPRTGPVDFDTAGSGFDTTLAVYVGTIVTNLTLVAANDDDLESGGLRSSRLWFYAAEGTTYHIAIDGFGDSAGLFSLNWNLDSSLGISRLANGDIEISLSGVDWQRYTLLSSTNLLEWVTNVPTITMSGGVHRFTNSLAGTNGSGKAQLFRALRAP